MKRVKFPLLLSILLFFTLINVPYKANAEEKLTFVLSSSTSIVKIGQEVDVTIEGHNLSNVFGYELRLTYDPKVLKYRQASTTWEGFTVPPIVEGENITFAHTKIGNAMGEKGNKQLASLRFEAIAQGDTSITLTRVKLVDSETKSSTIEPDTSLKITVPLSFIDTKGHWAEAEIVRAVGMGWIKGYPDGRFAPDKEVNRAEFTTMLSRALALSSPSPSQLDQTFNDHEQIPAYAKPHVAQSVAAGLVKGYQDETFRPSQWITRNEITVMLMRVIGYDDKSDSTSVLTYDDAEQVPAWAYSAIAAAADKGIVKGRGNNKFAPDGYTTRAEAVTLILRIIDHIASASKVN